MGLDLTTAAGILKDVYAPKVREQLSNKVFLLSQLTKDSDDVEWSGEGAEAVLSLHVQRSSAVRNIADGGTLPTPANQKYTKARVPLKTITGRIRFTVQTLTAMKTNKGAWERAATSETRRMSNDMRRAVNRQLAGSSDGTVATTKAKVASNVIDLAATTSYVQMEQLEVGMVIDISAAATPGNASVASAREITAKDETALTITISGTAVATSAGDRVEVSGSGGSGASQKEFTGLQTICNNTGDLHGVSATTYPVWKATVDANGGVNRTPTENLFEKAMHSVDRKGEGQIDLWLVEHGVERGYSSQLTSLKRFPNTLELKGGYKGLSVSTGVGTAAMVSDRDIPANTAFGITSERIGVKEWEPLTWLEDPEILRQVPDKLEYEATAYWIAELCTDARNSHAAVKDLTAS